MAKVNFTPSLSDEYLSLYKNCTADASRYDALDALVATILQNRARYENVADALGIPWYLIAAIHNMESGQDFSRHLHNGDPLDARTTHVPAGRPAEGEAPFTWEESAVDALKLRKLERVEGWGLSRVLYELEGYNGWGYRLYHPHVLSPYLWSFSNHYSSGKYVADGRWSDSAKSAQCGGALIIRRLDEMRQITLEASPPMPLFAYSDDFVEGADELQRFLNKFGGISLRTDGKPGEKTSQAVKTLFGFYLQGDPRET